MRVNPNPMPDLLAALNQTELEAQQAELQISSGKSVNEPSDNPSAAAQLVENNDQATFNSGYLQTLSAVQGQLSTSDSTLSSVTTALQQAISLGVEGANGTLSDSDRAAIASQLQGIQNQLLSLANTSYEGHFVFAGTNTNTAPYVVDSALPSGVKYAGNAGVNEVPIGSGYKVAVNVPGSQLFSAPGNDVFLAINSLIQAMQTNTGIPAAVNAVSAAFVAARVLWQRHGAGDIADHLPQCRQAATEPAADHAGGRGHGCGRHQSLPSPDRHPGGAGRH
jgi:flagellar hook-associated protein 3 FlgL